MTFYKLFKYENYEYIYFNPEMIEYYNYINEKQVMIQTLNQKITVSKSDFINMLTLEGIDEY